MKKDIISIYREDNDYKETKIYDSIPADVQLRAYNIRDYTTESMVVENTQKYYIMLDKKYTLARPWDYIIWIDDLWQIKKLLITSLSMEIFISRKPLIEIRAKDYETRT